MSLWCSPAGIGGWAVMVAIWASVVGVAVWALCRLFPAEPPPDPRAALDARLAAGDVDPETYRWVRQQLDGHAPAATKGPR